MDSYLLQIKPIKEIKLDNFYSELAALIDSFKTDNEDTKLVLVPASNCILLTTTNLNLKFALSKNKNYISVIYPKNQY
jgi:hypothetical protein